MKERNSYVISKGFRAYFKAVIILMVSEQFCSLLDLILVGNFVNPEAFAALDLVVPIENLIRALFLLLVGGSSAIASIHVGNREYEKANKVMSVAIISSVTAAAVFTAAGLLCLDSIVRFICPDPTLAVYPEKYLKIFFCGLIPMGLYFALSAVINVEGKPMVVTKVVIAACIVDLLMDVLLMKIFDLGVAGLAYATLASYVVPAVLFIIFLRNSDTTGFKTVKTTKEWRRLYADNIKHGVAFCLPFIFSCIILYIVNTIVMDNLGTEGLYVWGAGYQILSLGILFMESIGGTILVTMGGMLMGCHDSNGLKELVRKCFTASIALCGLLVVFALVFPGAILSLFGDEVSVYDIPYARQGLLMIALFLIPFVFSSLQMYLAQVTDRLTGTGLLYFGMFASVFVTLTIWSRRDPHSLFAAMPAAAGAFVILQIVIGEVLRRVNHPDRSPVFFIPEMDMENSLYLSVPYTKEGLNNALTEIAAFLEKKEMNISLTTGINICCEELMLNMHEQNLDKGEGYFYDLFIVIEENGVKVTVKDVGEPYNPIRRFEKTAAESFLAGEEMDLSLQILNKVCKDLNYSYMYNQNVISMAFGEK